MHASLLWLGLGLTTAADPPPGAPYQDVLLEADCSEVEIVPDDASPLRPDRSEASDRAENTPYLVPAGFQRLGLFAIRSRLKLTDDAVMRVTVRPVVLEVFTSGLEILVRPQGIEEATSVFEIYHSDGVGRLDERTSVLEVVPGLQGMSQAGGVLRHVRLTRDALTLTQFGGISNQTTVTHAVAIAAATDEPSSRPTATR